MLGHFIEADGKEDEERKQKEEDDKKV